MGLTTSLVAGSGIIGSWSIYKYVTNGATLCDYAKVLGYTLFILVVANIWWGWQGSLVAGGTLYLLPEHTMPKPIAKSWLKIQVTETDDGGQLSSAVSTVQNAANDVVNGVHAAVTNAAAAVGAFAARPLDSLANYIVSEIEFDSPDSGDPEVEHLRNHAQRNPEFRALCQKERDGKPHSQPPYPLEEFLTAEELSCGHPFRPYTDEDFNSNKFSKWRRASEVNGEWEKAKQLLPNFKGAKENSYIRDKFRIDCPRGWQLWCPEHYAYATWSSGWLFGGSWKASYEDP